MAFPVAAAITGGASLLGGLFGTDSEAELTDEQRRLYHLLLKAFQASHRFANSPVLSTDQERQGLAQAQGLASQSAARNRQGLFSQASPADLRNPALSQRMLSNMSANETAQQSGIYGNAMMQGLQARQQARFGWGPQLLGQANSIASNPGQRAQGSGFESLLPYINQIGRQWGSRDSTDDYGGGTSYSFGNGGTPGGTGFEPAQPDPTGASDNWWWSR